MNIILAQERRTPATYQGSMERIRGMGWTYVAYECEQVGMTQFHIGEGPIYRMETYRGEKIKEIAKQIMHKGSNVETLDSKDRWATAGEVHERRPASGRQMERLLKQLQE